MGFELLQKIADSMDGTIMDGKTADDQKNQIEEESKKPEKKPEKKKEKPPFVKKPENGETAVPADPADSAPAEGVPAEGGATQVPGAPIEITSVIDFFQQNPNPQDSDVHAFAEQNGIDPSQLESMIYGLAQKAVNLFRGGKSVDSQLDINSVNQNELQMGIEVEYEHSPDQSVAKKIALDHLAELPDYYTRLKVMEEAGSAEANAAAVPVQNLKEECRAGRDKRE